jgi:hypothetical protein
VTRLLARSALLVALFGAFLLLPGTGAANHFCNMSINNPGTYNLPHDHACPAAGTAVTINADNVTLNLRGHTIDGQGTGTVGIDVDEGRTNVVIRNGYVVNFETGIRALCDVLIGSRITGLTLLGLRVAGNTKYGIDLCTADDVTIENTLVDATGGLAGFGVGITTFSVDGLTITSSAVRNSDGAGISIGGGDDALITETIVSDFGGVGIHATGTDVDGDITIENSAVGFGGGTAIAINQRTIAVIRGVVVAGMLGTGIDIECSPAGVLEDTTVKNSTGDGIVVDDEFCSIFSGTDGWQIRDNLVRGNGGNGISILAGEQILTDNTLRVNDDDGIFVGSDASGFLTGNRARRNGDDGFQLDTADLELTDNESRLNTGWGFETNFAGPVAVDNGNTAVNNTAGECSDPSDLPNTSC